MWNVDKFKVKNAIQGLQELRQDALSHWWTSVMYAQWNIIPVITFGTAEHHHQLAITKLYCLMTMAKECEHLTERHNVATIRQWVQTANQMISNPTPHQLHHHATHLIYRSVSVCMSLPYEWSQFSVDLDQIMHVTSLYTPNGQKKVFINLQRDHTTPATAPVSVVDKSTDNAILFHKTDGIKKDNIREPIC